jgi:uroporphyrin-III C-methyltransferase/precorrin-2 dehydrogenase/sirohydrochlorin ferrochelatase
MGEKPLRILVFGRAGEEITQLRAQGIAVAFAPGITAGSAMAVELGASLTHRDHAHSVRFVTAHSRQGELPADLDWRGLADCETMLVFYMGGRTAPAIAARLMHEGLDGATPVVIQEAVSRPEARLTRMTLERLAGPDVFAFGGQPTLIGIGRVFADQAIDARRILDDAVAGQPGKQASA